MSLEPRPGAEGMTRGVWVFTGSVVGVGLILVGSLWNLEPSARDYERVGPGTSNVTPSVSDGPDRLPREPSQGGPQTTTSARGRRLSSAHHAAVRSAVSGWSGPEICVREIGEGPSGTIMLTFTIEPSGEISSTISWRLDDLREQRFADCLEERSPEIPFPELGERVVATAKFAY